LALYGAALDHRRSLVQAQDQIQASFDIAKNEFLAGGVSNLDVLTTEQSLIALNAAVASADTELVEDQIAVFKALGGGWRKEDLSALPSAAH
jgi:outer membrane protein TolC